MSEEISPIELDFFLRFPIKPHVTSPVDFLSHSSWGGICSLASKDEFRNLDRDIETSPKRWKKIVEVECPEREKFPQVIYIFINKISYISKLLLFQIINVMLIIV